MQITGFMSLPKL